MAEAETFGLTLAEVTEAASVAVWPDNVSAVNVFYAMSTQWRTAGMAGVATGLDYNVLYRKMDRLHLSEPEYDDVEECVRVMEVEAMKIMREKQ